MADVTIYTRTGCGYCTRALAMLEAKGVAFDQIDAGADAARKAEMVARSGRQTFPQIFIGEKHIGGCDDLMALEEAGKLDALLKA